MMRRWVQQGWAIARLTMMETLRQPIALLLTSTVVAAMALLPLIHSHTLGDSARMIADSALSLHFLAGLFFAGFAACHGLMEESRRGTGAMVLSKPVARELFFFSKFAGIGLTLVLFSLALSVASLLSVRIAAHAYDPDLWAALPLLSALPIAFALAALVNYLTRRPFVSDAFVLLVGLLVVVFLVTAFLDRRGQWTQFGAAFDFRIIRANVLIAMALWILAAIALALATRFSTVATLTLCSALFLIGLLSDYLLGRPAQASTVAAVFYALIPNWQHFWVADALHLDEAIPWIYIRHAAAYGVPYLIGVLALGIFAFRRTEVAG